MPWSQVWVEPELFLEHNGVRIYHTYSEDDQSHGVMPYRFTTVEDDGDYDYHFDVRELPGWHEPPEIWLDWGQSPAVRERNIAAIRDRLVKLEYHKGEVIIAAIESGLLKAGVPYLGPEPEPIREETTAC